MYCYHLVQCIENDLMSPAAWHRAKTLFSGPKDLSRGSSGTTLSSHRPPCPKYPPALMLCGWCCVSYIPCSSLPCSPSIFRVLLTPKVNTEPKGQNQSQAHFLKSTFSQASLLQRNLAESFTLSHSLIFQLVGSYCL